jgi:hypothetical protein
MDPPDTTCSICLTEIEPDEERIMLACKHLFHAECINEWCKKKRLNTFHCNCPNCRKIVSERDIPRVLPDQIDYENWDEFYEQLTTSWGNHSDEDTDIYGVIPFLLHNDPSAENAQEGLDGLIRACIDGQQFYGNGDKILALEPLIDQMVEMGAVVDTDFLEPEEGDSIETEISTWGVIKAMLLKITERHIDELPEAFVNATPIYWEDMDDEQYSYDEAYYNALKYEYNRL